VPLPGADHAADLRRKPRPWQADRVTDEFELA
jgi:hypothetical protein